MLEQNELARALTELPDELLMEQTPVTRLRKPIKFRRLLVAAAVIAVLTVTAGAAAAGITWDKNKVSRQDMIDRFGGIWEEYYNGPDSMGFEKLEYLLPLEVTELPEENMAIIRDLTWRADHWNDGDEVDVYLHNYMGHYSIPDGPPNTFGTLADVERFLGIALDIPAPLRESIRTGTEDNECLVFVRLYARAVERNGALEPFKLVVSFQDTGYANNGQTMGTITLALTEEAAREGMLVESYSYEKEGEYWQEEQTVGSFALELFGNDPQEGFDGSAGAVYTTDGIGYQISAHRNARSSLHEPDRPYFDSAKEMLLSLFADSE